MLRSIVGFLILSLCAVAVMAPTAVENSAKLSSAIASRLAVNGFNPADPQLQSKLAEFARKRLMQKPALNLTMLRTGSTMYTRKATTMMLDQGHHVNLGMAAIAHTLAATGPAPVIVSVLDSGGFQMLHVHLPSAPIGSSTYDIHFDLGSCGAHSFTVAASDVFQPNTPPDYGYNILYWLPTYTADSTPGTVSLSTGGQTSNALRFTYPQSVAYNNAQVDVSAAGPGILGYSEPNLGWSIDSTVLFPPGGGGDRVSTNPFAAQGGSGEDIVGRGIYLLNAWTATAQIQSWSYMDAPGYTIGWDSNRGAKVTQVPAGGRLETRVQWFYNPGESISYAVLWQLQGPAGLRAFSVQPKQSSCAGEQ